MSDKYDAKLWAVLEERKMSDLSQFHQPGFFDEAPLYTRESEVDFLQESARRNSVLLRFAFKFLKSVIAYEQHPKGYFAAITLWNFSDDLFVPNIFVWCRPIRELEVKLALRAVASPFGKRIATMIPKQGLDEHLSVLEETETEPGSTRVFIGPAVQPYQGFVTLNHFRSTALKSK